MRLISCLSTQNEEPKSLHPTSQAKLTNFSSTIELKQYCMVEIKNSPHSFVLNTGEKKYVLSQGEVKWLAMISSMNIERQKESININK